MKYRSICIVSLFCAAVAADVYGDAAGKLTVSAASSAASAYASMLTDAPAMLGQSYLAGSSGTLGEVGETLAAQNILSAHLRNSGNWISLSPRIGRQGLDHIFIKTDRNGTPRGLMIGESKYGHSQLGVTKDGIQMGSRWTNKRLIAMGNRYIKLSTVTKIEKAPGIGNHHEMKVVLKNGKEVCFWRQNSQDSWKFSGGEQELHEAQTRAATYGRYLKGAGEGIISYRSRVFQIQPEGDDIVITIRDASNVDKLKTIANLPKSKTLVLSNAMNQKVDPQTVAAELKKKLPHLKDDEIRVLSKNLSAQVKNLTTPVTKLQMVGKLATVSSIATGVAVGIDVVMQLVGEEKIDFGRTAITGGAVFLGTMMGQALNLGLNHWQWSQNMLKALSGKLGCSATMLSSAASSAVSSVGVSLLIAYGMYFAGYLDLDTANAQAVAGSLGGVAGTLAGVGVVSFATAVGTASTGTAISALGGAAANSAALAWLGGGAASAGGGGVAVGACVVGGVVIVAAVITTYAVFSAYSAVVESKDRERIAILLNKLSGASEKEWELILRNNRAIDAVL